MSKNIDTKIKACNVSKAFKSYNRKRDVAKQVLFGDKRKYYEENYVLNDISFELREGEAMGIIGRNGSGKSTLLQIVCGTLKPTKGSVETNGKIAALLELGSGFNPDFTGMENIYLNATLLGLKKRDIDEKLDKILAFADIGNYIDQSVRTYSSGIVVRLAFSVMAHVNADILIIDEALAVGDAYFTQKCMRYIQRFREEGSLLFVSHDASAVMSLCDRALLLNKGELIVAGSPKKVIEVYTKELQKSNMARTTEETTNENKTKDESGKKKECTTTNRSVELENIDIYKNKWSDYRTNLINTTNIANKLNINATALKHESEQTESYGGKEARIQKITLENIENAKSCGEILGGEIVKLSLTFKAMKNIKKPMTGFLVKNDKGLVLFGDNTGNKMNGEELIELEEGSTMETEFIFTIPMLPAGEYSVTVSVAEGEQAEHKILHWMNDALVLTSLCSSISAGLAGIPMQSIKISTY